jgi:PAS domain S-box-containing protein
MKEFFDVSLDLLCLANFDGYFLKVNKECENVLGYSIDDLNEKSFLSLSVTQSNALVSP